MAPIMTDDSVASGPCYRAGVHGRASSRPEGNAMMRHKGSTIERGIALDRALVNAMEKKKTWTP